MSRGFNGGFLVACLGLLASCAGPVRNETGMASEARAESYAQGRAAKGVVLLDVNWGRRWACGTFENAQLGILGFDRMPVRDLSEDRSADLVLEVPSRLTARPVFVPYALIVEPGEYALSGFLIKVAKSMSDVSYWVAKRGDLMKGGEARGGSFKVDPGETVYIGNFFLDCEGAPKPWRYYTESDNFPAHLAQYKQKYPFLEVDRVTYRLFETTKLGMPYHPK
jgi:hypothetical protein